MIFCCWRRAVYLQFARVNLVKLHFLQIVTTNTELMILSRIQYQMKNGCSLSILLLILHFFPAQKLQAQTGITDSIPHTILWRVSGKDCKKPSYILGTMHLAPADWLYAFPEMKYAIDSTEFILSEAFTTDQIPASAIPKATRLNAMDIMTAEQYKYVDSFFVARVGEGITGNSDAIEMTVGEMANAIILTLQQGAPTGSTIMNGMDADIFTRFVNSGRKGARLDRIETTEFDSSSIDNARRYFAKILTYLSGSDKPDWNIYGMKNLDKAISDYKKMNLKYYFNVEDNGAGEPYGEFDYVPLKIRNQNWIPKILANISQKSCLIMVGFAHLRYKTGIISLLKEQGYVVEPVALTAE